LCHFSLLALVILVALTRDDLAPTELFGNREVLACSPPFVSAKLLRMYKGLVVTVFPGILMVYSWGWWPLLEGMGAKGLVSMSRNVLLACELQCSSIARLALETAGGLTSS
jgi:hypothetical protein